MYKISLLGENVNIVKGARDCKLLFYIPVNAQKSTGHIQYMSINQKLLIVVPLQFCFMNV